MELKKNLRSLAKFGQDRKGSIALKFALMVAGPMVFIDTVVGFFR
jgi:Flp pilus assembly protein TadG